MRRVHKLRGAPARERYLTDDEEKRLFAILVGRHTHIRPIVVVALHTGMRQGEILGLKWGNIDFEQETIYVAHTKTGRPRKLPMSKPVEVELRSLKQDASSEEHVFSYARTGLKSQPSDTRGKEHVPRRRFLVFDFTICVRRSQLVCEQRECTRWTSCHCWAIPPCR